MQTGDPAYLALFESGELAQRAKFAVDALAECRLCPRQCGADRSQNRVRVPLTSSQCNEDHLPAASRQCSVKQPYCRTSRNAVVSSAFAHHGEELCLRGNFGSGTIFFCHCNLRCVFCQNFDISWEGRGREMTAQEIAALMLDLQRQGCHNINLVTPSHVIPQILEALLIAVGNGLRLPLVFNSGGYDSVETLRLLDGILDIYMPDFKFWDPKVAKQFANAENYPETAKEAIKEMHRQVGDLVLDERGIAVRGLLIRHLILPGGLSGAWEVMHFLAKEISPDTYLNLMAQYHPAGNASRWPQINRRITTAEYLEALELARDEGLRLDKEQAYP
jgi:putative pyruvate formate lyase activating enzyme